MRMDDEPREPDYKAMYEELAKKYAKLESKQEEDVTAAGMLRQVKLAIKTILVGGQSYKIGSRQLTRADLAKLYEMQADLEAQVASSSAGFLDDCFVAVFDRR